MNFPLISTYVVAIILLLSTPGPVIALITGTAARHGSRKAFVTAVGANIASLFLIALATLILAGVVSLPPRFLSLLGIVGSLYIGYNAVTGLLSCFQRNKKTAKTPTHKGGFVKGFLTGISNPKDILFFVSFFPQFIPITQQFSTSIMTLSCLWIIFDYTVMSAYILTVKRWVSGQYEQHITFITSLFLLTISIGGIVYNLHELTGHHFQQ
ncbi:LysE family translocator [Vibrio salinus]|uniref:LysE family translocator n=1 Tax=Vibrio salinus TaxID=2899784 RepID=UPI001E527278|nr:LysE family translocator [Vibrio salinus]MCE0494775.1 LysE family translocator [Vibrio salinus]